MLYLLVVILGGKPVKYPGSDIDDLNKIKRLDGTEEEK